MLKGNEDLTQSLVEAYIMEKGTRKFYSKASAQVSNQKARKMFQELYHWEEKHMEFIQFLYQSILEEREMISFEKFRKQVDAPVTEAGLPVKALEAKMEQYFYSDDIGALKLAFEIEGKAYNLYRKLSQNAIDGNAKIVFHELMEQEKKHIDFLNTLKKEFQII